MRAIILWSVVLLIFMVPCSENCSISLTVETQLIDEMIDSLGSFCSMPVKILRKEHEEEQCDRWALVYEVYGLLEKLNFTHGKKNYVNKKTIIKSYVACIEEEDYDVKIAVDAYLQTVNMNLVEILQRVKDSILKLHKFEAELGSASECISYYYKHGQDNNDGTKEKSEDRTKNEHNQSNLQLLIVVPLVVLVLLFLCGFLYYRYQYRKLRRRLTMSCDQDLTINHIAESPEERVHLQIECDVV